MKFDPSQLQNMISQAQQQAEQLNQEMARTVIEASAGGGSVTVRMNGKKNVLSVAIDPEVVNSGDIEMLQDLMTAAFNEAGRKVDDAMQTKVGGMLGGLNIPGL